MARTFVFLRLLLVGVVSLLILGVGYVGAQVLWHRARHRYDQPNTGLYYGYVGAVFHGWEGSVFSLSFRGETPFHWYWAFPINFSYRSLALQWNGASQGTATVSLPSFEYRCEDKIGILSCEVLNLWILGRTNAATTPGDVERVKTIYSYIRAASDGTLPPPNHHGYYLEEPVMGRIQHFRCGYGVGGIAYIWVAVWASTLYVGYRLSRSCGKA